MILQYVQSGETLQWQQCCEYECYFLMSTWTVGRHPAHQLNRGALWGQHTCTGAHVC